MNVSPEYNGIDWLLVQPATPLAEILARQEGATQRGLPAGITLVVDGQGRLTGTITDGDVRRALLKNSRTNTPSTALRADAMQRLDPICFPEHLSYREILRQLPRELEQRGRRSHRFLGKIILVDADRRPVRILDYHQLWEQRVATHRHVVVLGLGYVGLTLALVLAEEGFQVTGVDIDAERVMALTRGEPYVHEPGIAELLREQLKGNFIAAEQIPPTGDVFLISVGTPVEVRNGAPQPALGALGAVAERIAPYLRPGALVVLRSTVPVGTTRRDVLPLLEAGSGLVAGTDFHLAFAPERTAEGRALEELRWLPQIIGGLNEDSVEATAALFRELTPTLVRVESLEAAELAKLINNSFRDLSFAFANHIARLATPFNLDTVEVIRAANRGYPRDPVPLPSPGVGGPCLTKDPYILAALQSAQEGSEELTLFAHGRRINEGMIDHVVRGILRGLRTAGKEPSRCTLLLCGLAFKGDPETTDIRSSTAAAIATALQPHVAALRGHDPVVPSAEIATLSLEPVPLPAGFTGADGVLFLNNHPTYRHLDIYSTVRALTAPGVIYDGWHLFRPEDVLSAAPCVYLGLSFLRSSLLETAEDA